MAGTESYGGKCLICGKNTLQKWESCGDGFMFDACPWCGFIGTTQDSHSKDMFNKALDMITNWKTIFNANQCNNFKVLIESLKLTPNQYNSESSEFYPGVLDYSDISQLEKSTIELEEFLAFKNADNIHDSMDSIVLKLVSKGIEVGDMVVGYLDSADMSLKEARTMFDGLFTGIVTSKNNDEIIVKWVNGQEKKVDFAKEIIVAVKTEYYEKWHNELTPQRLSIA